MFRDAVLILKKHYQFWINSLDFVAVVHFMLFLNPWPLDISVVIDL